MEQNELTIIFQNMGYVYYKTNKTTASEALGEFVSKVDQIMDTSNLPFEDYIVEAVLRDDESNDIDSVLF